MDDHDSGKAVVFHEKNAVQIPFRNFSAKGSNETSLMSGEEVYAYLVVFNSFEDILDPTRELKDNVKKMISGLASEISLAYVQGWKVAYYTSFKKYVGYGEDNLPREFTSSEDDEYYNKTTKKDMVERIHSLMPFLQKVRFIGIISKKELDEMQKSLQKDGLKLESDSPYLVISDK